MITNLYDLEQFNSNFVYKGFMSDESFVNKYYFSSIISNARNLAISLYNTSSSLNTELIGSVFKVFAKVKIDTGLDSVCFLASLLDMANKETIEKLSTDMQRTMYTCGSLLLDGSSSSIPEEELHKFFESLTNVECFIASLR